MDDFPSTEHSPRLCPRCGYMTDRSSHLLEGHKVPKPGDLNICLKCGVVCEIMPDASFRPMAPDELLVLPDETKDALLRIQLARVMTMQAHPMPADTKQ